MFDADFFPSPIPVVERMLGGVNLYRKSILEPSAGKGDILDWIVNQHGQYNRNIIMGHLFAIEKNQELQSILRGKGYAVIDSDFLEYAPERYFDLIVMNPPFSQGARHLTHAIEIADTAQIICLLNSSTLANDWSKERQVLQAMIERRKGEITDLGACFVDAERKTGVQVSLVNIPARERKRIFDFAGNAQGEKNYSFQDIANNQLAPADVFESLTHRYNRLKSIGHQIYQLLTEANFYADGLLMGTTPVNALIDSFKFQADHEVAFEKFVETIRNGAWRGVYSQTKLSGMVTTKVRNDLEDSQKAHGQMAFSAENLQNLFYDLVMNLGNIRKDCLLQAFDILTDYHKDNSEHVEGWKTNDAWQIRPKVIIPYGGRKAKEWPSPGISRFRQSEIEDIEKALCFVTGKQFEEIKPNTLSHRSNGGEWGVWEESEFFMCKFFQKGTIHLRFKDKDVCDRFNIEVGKSKNWLPADYGRATV